LFFRYNFLCNTSASIWMFTFHVLNIRTSNLPNVFLIGIRGTQFMSCIYRVPIPIYVSLIRPMHRERCTISTNVCMKAPITWLDNSRCIFYCYIWNLLFYINKFYISLSNLDPFVNRMCLVPGSKTVTIEFPSVIFMNCIKPLSTCFSISSRTSLCTRPFVKLLPMSEWVIVV
jgi:hypothetical protein